MANTYRTEELLSYPAADAPIEPLERDQSLELDSESWPGKLQVPGWLGEDGPFLRRLLWPTGHNEKRGPLLKAHPATRAGERKDGLPTRVTFEQQVLLRETMVRFPSAPLAEMSGDPTAQPNWRPSSFHSIRILDHPDRKGAAERVYLFVNGLNETAGWDLFYRLSSWIIRDDPSAVCIARPLPGHLSRYAMSSAAFCELPLDRYMANATHLFRHFVRYMIEAQWLLSVLAPRDRYTTLAGARLVGTRVGGLGAPSRMNAHQLAEEVKSEWDHLAAARNAQLDDQELSRQSPSISAIEESIETIRNLVGWAGIEKPKVPEDSVVERPSVHAVGYSLGGFVAQSMFMTWPYAVASCTTVCSGGALSDLSPVAFAHAEEWTTLTHSLRPWLELAMVGGVFQADAEYGRVLGVRPELFEYFLRIFTDVFQQDFKPGYKTRISEYLRRLLFVVGGNDPIVRPRSVLDAAPNEGTNFISVAGLTHFLHSAAPIDRSEAAQRDFWLPQIGHLLVEFAEEAEEVHHESLVRAWRKDDNSSYPRDAVSAEQPAVLSQADQLRLGTDGDLDWELFDRFLGSLIRQARTHEGYVFILRNEIPTFMLPPEYQIHRAKALHHSDDRIRRYLDGLAWRQEELLELAGGHGVIVLLPESALDRLAFGYRHGHSPATSETCMGEFMLPVDRRPAELPEDVVAEFRSTWLAPGQRSGPHVRVFEPGSVLRDASTVLPYEHAGGLDLPEVLEDLWEHKLLGKRDKATVTRLPDAWMMVAAGEVLEAVPDPGAPRMGHALNQFVSQFARPLASPTFVRRTGRRKSPEQWRKYDQMRAIILARTTNNPRYRGRVLVRERDFSTLAVHSALALLRSKEWTLEES